VVNVYLPFAFRYDEFQEIPCRPIFAAPFDLVFQIWLADSLSQEGQLDASKSCLLTRFQLIRDHLSVSWYSW
jgi:hypothetical protein